MKLAGVATAFVLLAAACGNGSVQGDSSAAASVNDATLSRSELQDIIAGLPGANGNGTTDATDTADFLSNWVFLQGLSQELAAQGYTVAQADLDAASAAFTADAQQNPPGIDQSTPYGKFEVEQRATQLAAEPYITTRMTPADPIVPEYLCSSHILVATVEEADAVAQRLADGEDFAALAAEVSTGPSGPNGGDLGCVDTSTFVPEFIDGARAVAPSGVTGPVESQFGFHVIKVRSMGPLSAANHPEMDQAAIDSALQQANGSAQSGARNDAIRSIIDDVTARISGHVTIDPRYGDWSDGGVTPPAGVGAPSTTAG